MGGKPLCCALRRAEARVSLNIPQYPMSILKPIPSVFAGITMVLVSCAPKATVVEQAPAPKKPAEAKVPEPTVPEPLLPDDDGIRMGNLLEMPKDGDFRATNPSSSKPDGPGGSVISRPPTDPPSRVKPKEPGAE